MKGDRGPVVYWQTRWHDLRSHRGVRCPNHSSIGGERAATRKHDADGRNVNGFRGTAQVDGWRLHMCGFWVAHGMIWFSQFCCCAVWARIWLNGVGDTAKGLIAHDNRPVLCSVHGTPYIAATTLHPPHTPQLHPKPDHRAGTYSGCTPVHTHTCACAIARARRHSTPYGCEGGVFGAELYPERVRPSGR